MIWCNHCMTTCSTKPCQKMEFVFYDSKNLKCLNRVIFHCECVCLWWKFSKTVSTDAIHYTQRSQTFSMRKISFRPSRTRFRLLVNSLIDKSRVSNMCQRYFCSLSFTLPTKMSAPFFHQIILYVFVCFFLFFFYYMPLSIFFFSDFSLAWAHPANFAQFSSYSRKTSVS